MYRSTFVAQTHKPQLWSGARRAGGRQAQNVSVGEGSRLGCRWQGANRHRETRVGSKEIGLWSVASWTSSFGRAEVLMAVVQVMGAVW